MNAPEDFRHHWCLIRQMLLTVKVAAVQMGEAKRSTARELVELSLPAYVVAEESVVWAALMAAAPFGLAAMWMLGIAKSSQRTGAHTQLVHGAMDIHVLCAM